MAEILALLQKIISKLTPPIVAMGFVILCLAWMFALRSPPGFTWFARKFILIGMALTLKWGMRIGDWFFNAFQPKAVESTLVAGAADNPDWVKGAVTGAWLLVHVGLVLGVFVLEAKSFRRKEEDY